MRQGALKCVSCAPAIFCPRCPARHSTIVPGGLPLPAARRTRKGSGRPALARTARPPHAHEPIHQVLRGFMDHSSAPVAPPLLPGRPRRRRISHARNVTTMAIGVVPRAVLSNRPQLTHGPAAGTKAGGGLSKVVDAHASGTRFGSHRRARSAREGVRAGAAPWGCSVGSQRR